MAYKTPGVYIKEISVFPPSVAEVETAILRALSKDPEEKTELSEKLPEKAKELRARLQTWAQEIDAPTLFYGK